MAQAERLKIMGGYLVKDITNPQSICEAFQKALDEVVTPDNIEKILTDKYRKQEYTHVFSAITGPALGSIHMLTTDKRNTITITVTIHRKYNTAELPEGFLQKVYVKFRGTTKKAHFTESTVNKEWKATLKESSKEMRKLRHPEMSLKK